MKKQITVIPGDGIGTEVVREGIRVLQTVCKKFDYQFVIQEALAGGAAIDALGIPMPDETMQLCLESDAVLLGALGGPKYDVGPPHLRPERALLALRKELGAYINLRPVKVYSQLLPISPLKKELAEGVDIMIVRELTGGLYFGEPRGITVVDGEERGINTLIYTEHEIQRILKVGFELAGLRKKKLCSVEKANILETYQLWRRIAVEMGEEHPDIILNHMYVDNAAMQLILNPRQFDVIVSSNMFGDILSDEAAGIGGSLGLMPSASIGGPVGLYEPVHGSAPDIMGKNIANPIAMIKTVEMMFTYTLNLPEVANLISIAVDSVLSADYRTKDIYREGDKLVGTSEMGDQIVNYIENA